MVSHIRLTADALLIDPVHFLNMLGYDESAIGKLRVTDWAALEPWAVIKARNDDLIERRGHEVYEVPVRCRDGSILEVEVKRIRGSKSRARAISTPPSAISPERKRAEEELRNTVAVQRITVRGYAASRFSIRDASGRYTGGTQRVFPIRRARRGTKSSEKRCSIYRRVPWQKPIWTGIWNYSTVPSARQNLREQRGAMRRHHSRNNLPQGTPDGWHRKTPAGIVGIMTDITERKRVAG